MKRYLISLLFIGLLFLFSSTSLLTAQDTVVPPPVGERTDAPTYALHGPYWVGTQTIEMDAGTEDALRFTIWYPALNPDGLEESVTYHMGPNNALVSMYGFSPDAPLTVLGHALEGAMPDLSGAPYPLVINSHAFTAQMWQMYLGEHLASYGFVVIAPEHIHDSWSGQNTTYAIRILEVNRTITDAETLTAEDGALAGMIDVERIAVGGHSGGGITSYGTAGAPISWAGIEQYCEEFPDDVTCTDLDIQHQQVIDLLGTETGPDGLLPVIWDDRIDAIFPMAGNTSMYEPQGLKSITIPMMSLFGSVDPEIRWFPAAYENVSSVQKAQVVFNDAGHGIFYNQCETFPYILDYGFYWACSDPVWDLARTHDLTNHFVTAFLLATLYGDVDAAAALAPDAVSFPGITYKAEGF